MHINQFLQDKITQYVTQYQRYKKGILILFLLGLIVFSWSVFHIPEENHVPMESGSNVVSKSTEEKNEAQLLYNMGDALRGFPWREVLGDSQTMNGSASLKMLENENIDEGMSELVSRGELSNSKSKLHSNSKKKVKQVRNVNTESQVDTKSIESTYNTQKSIHINGIVRGPQSSVIVSVGSDSSVVMEGDSWQGIKVISVDDSCITLDEGGIERCVAVGEL
ncbi:hypothetical protein [Veillonella sp.]